MSNLTVKVNTQELVKSKFSNTLAIVNGYVQESKGDVSVDQRYSAMGVYSRMLKIQQALESDLLKLAGDININVE